MQKLFVLDPSEGSRVPFLRGILTRSLQEAGLSFVDSYAVASAVRTELADSTEITREELRRNVLEQLGQHGPDVVQRYRRPFTPTSEVLVRCSEGQVVPFSRGRHRRSLESCGFSGEDAALVARSVYDRFAEHGVREIGLAEIQVLTHEKLCAELGPDSGRRYLVWQEFRQSDRPLLLLVGGTTGSGKSTTATQLASVLDIVRVQSTDMLREVMRTMIPRRLLPVLHASSFNAWRELPGVIESDSPENAQLEQGYLTQVELLSVACEAVVQRALQERVSLILEGVHVHPSLISRIATDSDAIVVPLMLAVLKPTELRARIRGRGKKAPGRRSQRFLEHFDDLWGLQSFLLSEADRASVPIVPNDDQERTILQVLHSIEEVLAETFPGDPETVLG